MRIKIKSLLGAEYDVDVKNEQLVSELKVYISEQANGLPIERQKLVYKGRTLHDQCSLSDYYLEEGCKIHLIVQKDNPGCSITGSSSPTNNSVVAPAAGASSSAKASDGPSSSSFSPCSVGPSAQFHSTNVSMTTTTTAKGSQEKPNQTQSKFEMILRRRLADHFPPNTVEKIMINLQHEINVDINSSSLDDLERLAKQKLNISNE